MAAHDELYQKLILDHSRAPHNRGPLGGATATASRDNPLCGDSFSVSLELADGRIARVAFEGKGCAISMASASMMTDQVGGQTPAEAQALAARFDRLVAGDAQPGMGDLDAFAAVARLPVRAKCARLPWQALLAALAA